MAEVLDSYGLPSCLTSQDRPGHSNEESMRDRKAGKGASSPSQSATGRTAAPRANEDARLPGSGASVHTSLANEIGLRIVRGDYPPGSILPNEAKWSETDRKSTRLNSSHW